jgi:hypothetical protein
MDKDTLINRRLTGENSFQKNEEHEHGKHPNSLANLKPFEKGISGNPGGRPVKYAKLKKALDKWADLELDYDWWDLPPKAARTLKDQVHWRIWHKARQGCNKSIEILAKLGCLDDE